MTTDDQLFTLLQQHFGFREFRPGQLEAIRTLIQNNRLLCIQPTGHGKSLLYQLPSCLLKGMTLVISPLLALIRDQIEHLNHRFGISAASINTDQSEEENAQARQKAMTGNIKVLFISPEQLDHIDRFNFLLNLPISLVVIDEAHCISTWGHDFRPSYRQILHFIQSIEKRNPEIKILGLTATADERVERDIGQQLSSPMQKVHVLRENMDRPNIELSTFAAYGVASKLFLCKTLLLNLEGSGLIYCSTRENTELVAEYLQQEGFSIIAYHAGLDSEAKRKIQTAFSNDRYKVVSATTALGMGIDKGNLRFVIHFDIPGSITAYYQEVGRCGRDGLKAQGILLYDSADRKIQEYFIDSALPSIEDFEKVVEVVGSSEEFPNLTKIKRATGLHPTRVMIVVAELIEQGYLKKESIKGLQVYKPDKQDVPLDLSRYSTQYLVKTDELKKIISYAEQTSQCRMTILRNALGDENSNSCGHCDICLNTVKRPDISLQTLSQLQQWLLSRPVPIAEAKTHRISSGISILDGKLRTPLFIRFMQQRAHSEEIEKELLTLLRTQASILAAKHSIKAIVLLPSNTWKARESVAAALAEDLKVPVIANLLLWCNPPNKRQGELLNNDQRHENVQEKMQANKNVNIPSGSLLLLDDYIGSGSTIKEAARALRQLVDHPLVPFTIASVKWHLGKPGFI
ncbi:MAG: RecQ family ATP-dependent DNA helicase [Anaerolineae bacterium]